MRFLCRWPIAWPGVPSSGPIAVAIAIAIVGGTLLETGFVARTPIPSSDARAPIAAVTGSGDVLVAMAAMGRDLTNVPQGVGESGPVLLDAMVAAGPVLAAAGFPDVLPFDLALGHPAELARPGALAPAIDPDGPSQVQTLVASASTTVRAAGPRAGTPRAKASARRGSPGRRRGPWRVSPLVTWYGPGFYGRRTACGQRYSRYVVGVAHRTLPCGTLVQFQWHGRTAVAPVIDRGPYGPRNLVFDWSAWLACHVFRPHGMRNGCFTRSDVHYRVVGRVDLHAWFKGGPRHR